MLMATFIFENSKCQREKRYHGHSHFRRSQIKRNHKKLTCPCIFIITTVFVRLQTTMLSGFFGNRWTELTLTLPPAEAPIDLNVLIHSVVFVFQTFTVPSDEALINWCPSETKERKKSIITYLFTKCLLSISVSRNKRERLHNWHYRENFLPKSMFIKVVHTSNHQPSKIWKHCSSYC